MTNLYNHKSNCRICLNPFSAQNQALRINNDVEKRFLTIFHTKILISPNFSKRICVSCDTKLKEIMTFVESVKMLQTELLNLFENEKNKNFESPKELQIKIETPSDVTFEEVYFKSEPEEISEVHLVFDPELDFRTKNAPEVVAQKRKLKIQKIAVKNKKIKIEPKSTKEIPKSSEKRIKDQFMCTYCGTFKQSEARLEDHIAGVHLKSKKFACDLCSHSCSAKRGISAHVKTHIAMERRKIHNCIQCSYIAPSKSQLKSHVANVHGENKYTCFCGISFTTKTKLKSHNLRVHEKLLRHSCKDCDKSFFSSSELFYHQNRDHKANLRQFKCLDCNEVFLTPRTLSHHRIMVHVRKYQCTFDGCASVFHTQNRLKEHMNVHSGQRDKLCHLCEKAYFTMNHLRNHLDVAHNRTTFFCEFCDFTNSRRDYLGNHLKNHHKLDRNEMQEVLKRAKFIQREV